MHEKGLFLNELHYVKVYEPCYYSIHQEAALLKVSPHLLFTLKDKKVDKTYYLLMSSDYERSVWRDTILGLMAQGESVWSLVIRMVR